MFYGLNINISASSKDRQQAAISRQLPLKRSNLEAKAIVNMTQPLDPKPSKPSNAGREALSSSDTGSGIGATAPKTNEDPALEQSFEKAFAKARQSACACVVRGLDPRRPWYKSTGMPSSCAELLWRGHPVQEKVVRACHFYTLQWLSERDTSWWAERITLTRYTPLRQDDSLAQEPELVKAIGAWSLDLASDPARDAFLSSAKIDTVPGSKRGLIDANSRLPSSTTVGKPNESLSPDMDDQCDDGDDRSTTEIEGSDCQQSASKTLSLEVDYRSSTSDTSSDTYAESDIEAIDQQVEGLLPAIIESIISRAGTRSGTISATGSSFTYDHNTSSQTPQNPNRGRKKEQDKQNGQKRKRSQGDDGDHEGSGGDDDEPSIRIPNAMPLQDKSARLACHFHMLYPNEYCDGSSSGKKYKTCALGFKDSKDLREHLKKKHCGPKYFCFRCYKQFEDGVQKAAHDNSEVRCRKASNWDLLEEGDILEGTERRVRFNSMKKPRLTSHEEHWFDVWSILFPHQPFPTTPYMPHDAFDVAYGRIADEEITRVLFAQDHRHLAQNPTEATRYLRRFANRILERLHEEFDAGRLTVGGATPETPGTANVDDNTEVGRSDHNEEQHHSQSSVQSATGYHTPHPNLVNAYARTTIPAHAHYSTQGWQDDVLPTWTQNPDPQQNAVGTFQNGSHTTGFGSFEGYNSQPFNDSNVNFNPQNSQMAFYLSVDDAAMQNMQNIMTSAEHRRHANIHRGASQPRENRQ